LIDVLDNFIFVVLFVVVVVGNNKLFTITGVTNQFVFDYEISYSSILQQKINKHKNTIS